MQSPPREMNNEELQKTQQISKNSELPSSHQRGQTRGEAQQRHATSGHVSHRAARELLRGDRRLGAAGRASMGGGVAVAVDGLDGGGRAGAVAVARSGARSRARARARTRARAASARRRRRRRLGGVALDRAHRAPVLAGRHGDDGCRRHDLDRRAVAAGAGAGAARGRLVFRERAYGGADGDDGRDDGGVGLALRVGRAVGDFGGARRHGDERGAVDGRRRVRALGVRARAVMVAVRAHRRRPSGMAGAGMAVRVG